MPYTPPSHPSPVSSALSSSNASRRSSLQSTTRPNLPKSASYLKKHRRTPSADITGDIPSTTPNGAENTKTMVLKDLGGSVRQSPPLRVDKNELIPKGAVISPPDSTASGSDDDEPPEIKSRRSDVLQHLRDAVSKISKSTTPPPQHTQPQVTLSPSLHISQSTSALSDIPSAGRGRKLGHVRCATEPCASTKSSSSSSPASEDDTDEDLRIKPQMVRKKSGELVRPALRGHRRPSSMPGTPLSSKAVHFDSHLEHVRHFLQVDRPLAVSAGSSPAEVHMSDSEYPFPKGGRGSRASPPFEWELTTPNFPHDSLARKWMPVRLERVWLSHDEKSLLGSVAVANLDFQKSVVCRFTLDYWKTISEVTAEYSHDIRPKETSVGQDRFTFAIKLSDMANLESKTLFFCIRYVVSGQEHWDNNNGTNFQVDFRKKYLPQNGKNGLQSLTSTPLGGLPRSNRKRSDRGTALRHLSIPALKLDSFGGGNDVFDFHEFIGDSENVGGLRFKSKSSSSLPSDKNAPELPSSPGGSAFSNRYDFTASLDAAVKAARDTATSGEPKAKENDTPHMKNNFRDAEPFVPPPASSNVSAGMSSPTHSISSASYEELVNKYCFFGSAPKQPTSIMKDGTSKSGTSDARKEQQVHEASSPNYTTAKKPEPDSWHTGGAAHHSMYHAPTNSYFSAADAAQNTSYLIGSQLHQEGFSLSLPPSRGHMTPPTLVSRPGRSSSDVATDRFPWTANSHGATAISS
ncbi:hypothetical protein E4U16_005328 [Claviceps sp. LM84 group G4]|nr:hypothetical protein E4U33_004965 [Claviceps sp. LM78 group G4]KAG6072462.1 hypothetical protein E4U16_005328 [Claviceps sp. LM84 group G4]